jgi:phosphatidylglycerophosphatase A
VKAVRGETLKKACITVLGSGYLPLAPGSWGSLAAALIYAAAWGIVSTAGLAWPTIDLICLAGVAAASLLAVRWGEWAVVRFAGRDPKPFVLDEFAGQWVALLFLPAAGGGWFAAAVVIGGQFVLFRALDVIKPPPARGLERLRAGWGILLDDLVAGAYANVLGQLLWRATPLAAWLAKA